MIDASRFLIERERLRRFCFQRTKSSIVILDVTCALTVGEKDPVSRLAEWLQFLLTVDASRFVDPDDACDNAAPSIFAFPTSLDTKGDVATILAASRGTEAIVVDYRVSEAVLPLLAPHLSGSKMSAIKMWDRALRRRGRICAVVTFDAIVRNIAIQYDGGRVLRSSCGEGFDIASGFWLPSMRSRHSDACPARHGSKKILKPRGTHDRATPRSRPHCPGAS